METFRTLLIFLLLKSAVLLGQAAEPNFRVEGLLRIGDTFSIYIRDQNGIFAEYKHIGDECFGYKLMSVDFERGAVCISKDEQTFTLQLQSAHVNVAPFDPSRFDYDLPKDFLPPKLIVSEKVKHRSDFQVYIRGRILALLNNKAIPPEVRRNVFENAILGKNAMVFMEEGDPLKREDIPTEMEVSDAEIQQINKMNTLGPVLFPSEKAAAQEEKPSASPH